MSEVLTWLLAAIIAGGAGWGMAAVFRGIVWARRAEKLDRRRCVNLAHQHEATDALLSPPVLSPSPCICDAWLDENRVKHGLTVQRFPDGSIPGRFHYIDCPLGFALALSDSRPIELTVEKLTATRSDA